MDLRARLTPVVAGRFLVAIGVFGLILSLVGTVVALRLLASFDAALDNSLVLTAEALDVVDASVQVTDDVVDSLAVALRRTEQTTREVADGIDDAVVVLDSTAELTEDELAGSLAAVEGTLPALIDVAAVIDRTLAAVSAVPFGPDYDPDQRFDDSLRSVQRELDGLPQALREQAALVRDASGSLATVRVGTVSIADDIGEVEEALRGAGTLLEGYASTADDARDVVALGQRDLDGNLRLSRVLVVALGVTMAGASLAPIGVGWMLLRSDAVLSAAARS